MIISKRLRYGDTIGIISPAGPESENFIKDHIAILKSKGFNIKEGKHLYDKNGFLAGTDTARAEDLMNMFEDKEVAAIVCFRGGYGTMRILPLIDFKIIKENPKIFVGYSDITTLLNYMSQQYNLITFHGPMINSNLNEFYTYNSFLETIMYGYEPYYINNPPHDPLLFTHFDSAVTGTLVGGNLTLLCSTIGTKYELNTEDKILFIEEVSEEPYKIDRMLTQLLLSNKLQKCSAFILGQFTDCDTDNLEKSLSLYQVIEDRILNLKKPTVLNLMSGHDHPKLTLPIGARIKIDPYKNTIKVLQKVVY